MLLYGKLIICHGFYCVTWFTTIYPYKIGLCCAGVSGMLELICNCNIFAHLVIISALISDIYSKFKIQTYWIGDRDRNDCFATYLSDNQIHFFSRPILFFFIIGFLILKVNCDCKY